MNVLIQRILFSTDFSETAEQALSYSIALAEKFKAELHVLHVIPPIPTSFPDSASSLGLPADYLTVQEEAAKKRMTQNLGAEWLSSHKSFQAVAFGFAVDEILRYATTHNMDLIVIGTHGHSGFSRFLLGSVAEKLVRISTCPVLTVHPKGHSFVAETVPA